MRTNGLYYTLTVLLTLLVGLSLSAASRLTVVIAVDGMSSEALDKMRPYWKQGGLRTLQEEAQLTQVSYGFDVQGGEETLTTLLTGQLPSQHGVWYPAYFDRSDKQLHPFFEDPAQAGIGTAEHLSLRRLSFPTLSDLFRLKHGDFAKIYAVGQQPSATLLLAGHAANACCWLDASSRQWVTTSYYAAGLPAVADEENVSGRIDESCRTLWMPHMQPSSYLHPTDQERRQGFSYSVCEVLHNTPKVNSLVVDMALRLTLSEQLGQDDRPDLLLLQLTTLSPKAQSDHLESAEQEDMYTTLNEYLGFLLDQLTARVGKEHLQVILTGIPRLGQSVASRERIGLTQRAFYADRAGALTSVYLMALYGNERWIDGVWGQSVFLNRQLIEQHGLSLSAVQRQVADFLMDFEGVQWAYPRSEALMVSRVTDCLAKPYIGDVVFGLQPGWQLWQDEQLPLDCVSDPYVQSPLWWWCPGAVGTKSVSLPRSPMKAEEVLPYLINQL